MILQNYKEFSYNCILYVSKGNEFPRLSESVVVCTGFILQTYGTLGVGSCPVWLTRKVLSVNRQQEASSHLCHNLVFAKRQIEYAQCRR